MLSIDDGRKEKRNMEDRGTVVVAYLSAAAALALRDSLDHFARVELGRIVFSFFFH